MKYIPNKSNMKKEKNYPIKIQDGDSIFKYVQDSYNRALWTHNPDRKKKK